MRKLVLLSTILFATPFAMECQASNCATTDCHELGYTLTSKSDNCLQCPFGNYWFCPQGSETTEPEPDDNSCNYGDTYYTDGTCSSVEKPGGFPIGVVVYNENGEKWVMTLEDVGFFSWSTVYYDIQGISNYTTPETAVKDLKSCENTQAMIAMGSYKSPLAQYANSYAPPGTIETKGKWCIPAAGIWEKVNQYRAKIDAALEREGYNKLNTSNNYWTSTEYDANKVWYWGNGGTLYPQDKSHYNSYDGTRLVMKIK